MNPHPRLYVPAVNFARVKERREDPWYAEYFKEIKRHADEGLDPATLTFSQTKHNWHLDRAKAMQSRLLTLAVEALISGDRRYVEAAMQHVQIMHDWEYWSWIAWRKNQSDPSAIYDLSYGENSATLAIVFDWLKPLLSAGDVALILKTARRPIDSYLKNGDRNWWHGKKDSNWNPVCSGGMGMLALSLFEHEPEASALLQSAETSITPFIMYLQETNGAWPEGTAYWNYGMRYAFMFLSSHENATGRLQSLLDAPSTRETVYFAPSFCPNGVPCSFGDANAWKPLPFHHAMALRVGADDLLPELRATHPEASANPMGWPNATETVLLVPDSHANKSNEPSKMASHKLYEGLDWGYIADKMPKPNVYLAVRGGTTEVPHGHRDLMSFHAVMGGESVVTNHGMNEYLDTTFSKRRYELYDTVSASKNVVLINGVGITKPAEVKTEMVSFSPKLRGFWMDAKEAMGRSRHNELAATSSCRLFLLVEDESLLILDSLELPNHGRCEARWHTSMVPTQKEDVVHLAGQKQKSTVMHACNHPGKLSMGLALFTNPTKVPIHAIRWMTEKLETRIAFATWITPGEHARPLSVKTEGNGISVVLDQETFNFDSQLRFL